MNDQQIEKEIQAKGLTAPRVSLDRINALLARVVFVPVHRPNDSTSTFVHAYLDGRFYLASGHSACVSPENYDTDIGAGIAVRKAKEAAVDKLWELEGYRLYCAQREA